MKVLAIAKKNKDKRHNEVFVAAMKRMKRTAPDWIEFDCKTYKECPDTVEDADCYMIISSEHVPSVNIWRHVEYPLKRLTSSFGFKMCVFRKQYEFTFDFEPGFKLINTSPKAIGLIEPEGNTDLFPEIGLLDKLPQNENDPVVTVDDLPDLELGADS